MKLDDGDYLISSEELPALCDLVGAHTNALSVIQTLDHPFEPLEDLKADFGKLNAAEQRSLGVALAILRAPAKVASLHHTIADETISRGQLAWSHSLPDSIIALARTGDQRRLSYWTESSLGVSLRKILVADQTLSDDEMGCKLSTSAVITFLAILEQLRYVRLYSIVTHAQPTQYFSPAEIMDRLAGAVEEDFRWPLLFVEKVIPGGLVSSLSEADVIAALKELAAAQLVEPVVETENVRRYELTDAGKVICDGVLHDVSKVAICVADMKSDGQAGFDMVLLVRSSFHLFMFAMAGQTGAVAALNNDEMDDLLKNILTLHSSAPPVQADIVSAPPGTEAGPSVPDVSYSLPPSLSVTQQTPEISETISCSQCGFIIAKDSAFCGTCGTPVKKDAVPTPPLPPLSKVCPNCNKSLGMNSKFCGGCGKPV
jgi:hypothetical protein